MDRTLVLEIVVTVPRGHRIEVNEAAGEAAVLAVTDLETGVRFRTGAPETGETTSWIGVVLSCTVTADRTTLLVDPVGTGFSEAEAALRSADAAADAAASEAHHWGGVGKKPAPDPLRTW